MNAVINKPRAKKGNVALAHAQAAKPDHPAVFVGKTLMDLLTQLEEAYEPSNLPADEMCMHASTLIKIAMEILMPVSSGKAADEDTEMYRVAGCLAGALAYDQANAPSANERHKLLKGAYDLAESASISYGFADKPCVALAHGIAAGKAAGAVAGTRDPLHGHTPEQAAIVFERIASMCDTTRSLVYDDAQGEQRNHYAIGIMLESIGALADGMIGGEVMGTHAEWSIGHNFREAGKAVQG